MRKIAQTVSMDMSAASILIVIEHIKTGYLGLLLDLKMNLFSLAMKTCMKLQFLNCLQNRIRRGDGTPKEFLGFLHVYLLAFLKLDLLRQMTRLAKV